MSLIKCAQGSFEEAEYFCQKGLDLRLIELPPDNIDVGVSFETFGIIYNAQSKYDEAIAYFHKSEMIAQHINRQYPLLVRIYHETGSVFYNRTEYDRALEYYTKAAELAVKLFAMNRALIDSLNYGLNRVMDLFL